MNAVNACHVQPAEGSAQGVSSCSPSLWLWPWDRLSGRGWGWQVAACSASPKPWQDPYVALVGGLGHRQEPSSRRGHVPLHSRFHRSNLGHPVPPAHCNAA